ncbi:MAG: hypothetical protein OEV94_05295 [Deltaproteobacteria bacterium]|nr:hypothetical protein [Deltaproteobacteria bacterium]
MAENEQDNRNLPWLFVLEREFQQAYGADYDPYAAVYKLYRNTRNPHLRRALAPVPSPGAPPPEAHQGESPQISPAEPDRQLKLLRLLVGGNQYGVGPVNVAAPYRRRSLSHPLPPPSAKGGLPHTPWQRPEGLAANLRRLPALVNQFFASVLGRLRENPASFKQEVEDLARHLHQNGIRVKVYEAYGYLSSWDHLMATLEEIARYPAAETFDLFCGALFTYYELVYPKA